jgi:hypothetical protein
MGAALECFPGAKAVCVPRSRFFPVKTCSDLLLLRSDAVVIDEAGAMTLAPECGGVAPVVLLDGCADALGMNDRKLHLGEVHRVRVQRRSPKAGRLLIRFHDDV